MKIHSCLKKKLFEAFFILNQIYYLKSFNRQLLPFLYVFKGVPVRNRYGVARSLALSLCFYKVCKGLPFRNRYGVARQLALSFCFYKVCKGVPVRTRYGVARSLALSFCFCKVCRGVSKLDIRSITFSSATYKLKYLKNFVYFFAIKKQQTFTTILVIGALPQKSYFQSYKNK